MLKSNTDTIRKQNLQVPEILFEDNHIIIVNKRVSDIVQGDKTGDVPLSEIVKNYIRIKYQKPGEAFLGVVHRLDRPVSGAVIFARTGKALTRLNNLVKNRQIQKTYWAVVKQKPPQSEGLLEQYLLRNEGKNKTYVYNHPVSNSQIASLHYKIISESEQYYLLEIQLFTGRHHQIRAQLAHLGCPIKGDLKYGFPRSNPDGSIHLHAVSLQFEHPVSHENIFIMCKPPEEPLWDFFYNQFKDKFSLTISGS
jgi:23S rRNA pseudouridine1911/1915/1917 synthase